MPIGACLASFPNSRIAARKATRTASVGVIDPVPVSGPVNALVRPANSYRTYLTIRNVSGTPIRYGYSNSPTLFSDGFLLNPGDSVDLESLEDVYVVSDSAVAGVLNWDEGLG